MMMRVIPSHFNNATFTITLACQILTHHYLAHCEYRSLKMPRVNRYMKRLLRVKKSKEIRKCQEMETTAPHSQWLAAAIRMVAVLPWVNSFTKSLTDFILWVIVLVLQSQQSETTISARGHVSKSALCAATTLCANGGTGVLIWPNVTAMLQQRPCSSWLCAPRAWEDLIAATDSAFKVATYYLKSMYS